MDQTIFFYYLAVIAILLIVLLFTYRWVQKYNANSKCATEIIIDAVKEYNEPLDVIMPAFSTTLRNFAEVTLYPDFIIQGDLKILRDDIECVTFNNYAPAEMPNEYQVIIKSAADPQTIITIPVGDDLHYAASLTERIKELYIV